MEAVRIAAIERADGKKLHSDTLRWLKWATKTANPAGPTKQMKEESDLPKRVRKPK
jgi:hypothetical protein